MSGQPVGPVGGNVPDFASIQRYAVNRAGDYEVYRQSLYDFQSYATAGTTTQYTFFAIPQGQSSKTLADTNMENAGSLPAPKHFLIQSIEIVLFPGVNPVTVNNAADTTVDATNFTNDMWTILKAGYLKLFIGSKDYLVEAPLMRFPPKTRIHPEFGFGVQIGQASAADLVGQISGDYATAGGRPYWINPWILLTPTQNFNVTLNFPTTTATPSGQNARIGVILDGILYRLSQ